MKQLIGILFLSLFFAVFCFAGCIDKAPESKALSEIQNPKEGEVVKVEIQTPATTTYKGEGKIVSREVSATRIFSPFGVSPGETISKQTPMAITEGSKPGIAINPQGIAATEQGKSSFTGGGGYWTWLDTIYQRIHDWGILGFGGLVIVAVGLAALYFFVPVAKPIISALFRLVASIFPIVGSLVERGIAKIQYQKPLEEVITGGQTFKDLIEKESSLDPDQKAKVIELFTTAHQLEQDTATQSTVKTIKANL